MGSAGGPPHDVVAHRKECGARECEGDAEHTEVLWARPLAGEGDATGDDERGADEEERAQRLVEQRQRDPDRHQRRGADQDRRP